MFLLSLILLTTTTQPAPDQNVRFTLKHPEIGTLEVERFTHQIDVPGADVENRSVDMIAPYEYFEELKEKGYDVTIQEIQNGSVDESYLNPEEVIEVLQTVKEQYPDLVQVEEIGKSLKGRPIYAARVSTPENNKLKPNILFNSMHHAREVMSPEVTMDLLVYLVRNFANPDTPWVQAWLENLNIWIVPQVNPDGNAIVWSHDNWWRKNAAGNEDSTWGVDINRNYPYRWGQCAGSSGSKGSQTYRGPKAASEPETNALMNLVARLKPVIDISYHSYSELVIAPYGCQSHYSAEKDVVDSVGKGIAGKLVKDSGTGSYTYGTGWEILYPVDGDDISWMYQEHNVLAYVVEVNSTRQGFQPDYAKWRDITVQRQRAGWSFALNRAMSGPQIRGQFFDAVSGKKIEGSLRILGLDYSDEKPRQSQDGVYFKILNPGSYEIEFESPGYETQSMAISVDEGVSLWDVYLQPL